MTSDTPLASNVPAANVAAPNVNAASADARDVTAIVLAGGTSQRFGGPNDDKLDADLGGHSVLDLAVASVPPWPLVIVGPRREVSAQDAERARWVRENPPHGGPAAALIAALPLVGSVWCAVLAGDTPHGGRLLPALLGAAVGISPPVATAPPVDGAQAVIDGRAQPLLAVYRTAALRAAAGALASPHDASMRALLRPLRLTQVDIGALTASAFDLRDIDTLDDLEAHRSS